MDSPVHTYNIRPICIYEVHGLHTTSTTNNTTSFDTKQRL